MSEAVAPGQSVGGFHVGYVGGSLSLQAAGDVVAGNKTVINHITQVLEQARRGLANAPYKFLAYYDIPDRDIFFGRDAIEAILAQDKCVGIKFYFAMDEASEPRLTLVLVGAEANEDDQVNGRIADFALPCPNHCGAVNKLNT